MPNEPRQLRQWLQDGTEVPRDLRDLMILIANRQCATDANVGALLREVATLSGRVEATVDRVRDVEHSRPDVAEVKETVVRVLDEGELKLWRGRVRFWRNIAATAIGLVAAGSISAMLSQLWAHVVH